VTVTNRDEYRQHALECLRLAHATNEPATRAVLTDMATAWIKLGEQAEKNGQTDLVYETPALHA
jgi:hypothetical protein